MILSLSEPSPLQILVLLIVPECHHFENVTQNSKLRNCEFSFCNFELTIK